LFCVVAAIFLLGVGHVYFVKTVADFHLVFLFISEEHVEVQRFLWSSDIFNIKQTIYTKSENKSVVSSCFCFNCAQEDLKPDRKPLTKTHRTTFLYNVLHIVFRLEMSAGRCAIENCRGVAT